MPAEDNFMARFTSADPSLRNHLKRFGLDRVMVVSLVTGAPALPVGFGASACRETMRAAQINKNRMKNCIIPPYIYLMLRGTAGIQPAQN
jgi:hypothetical protein